MADLYSTVRKPIHQQYGGNYSVINNTGSQTAVLPFGTTIPAGGSASVSANEWALVPSAARSSLSLAAAS